jgi:hypothetical protein
MSEEYHVGTVAADAGSKSCRRPLKVGRYDPVAESTVVSWTGENCAAFVAAYDHDAGEWSDPKRVGTSFEDYHNYPHLIQTDDGRLHVFHGCHNTPLRQSTAPRPHSIEGEWEDRPVEAAPDATYPMPFVTDDGTVFVFYRETFDVDDRPTNYVRSEDDGQTWTHSSDLTGDPIAIGHVDREDNMDETYVGQLRQVPGEDGAVDIHVAWTLAGGGPEGREHDRYHRNVYHAVFDPETLRFAAADGTDLGTWVDGDESETHCKILDTGPPSGLDVDYVQEVHATDDGRPLVVFGTHEGQHAATWTGEAWALSGPSGEDSLDLPDAVHDVERTGATSFRLYAGDPEGVRIYHTDDAGRTWREGDLIPFPTSIRAAVVIDDYREPIRLLAQESTDWSSFATDRDVYVAGRGNDPGS